MPGCFLDHDRLEVKRKVFRGSHLFKLNHQIRVDRDNRVGVGQALPNNNHNCEKLRVKTDRALELPDALRPICSWRI